MFLIKKYYICITNIKSNKMVLKEFKEYIENFEIGKVFTYGISLPFCWRGSYYDVAFEILEQEMKREEILFKINMAYNETFIGYKDGEYRFNDFTDIHFEEDCGSYSNGEYCGNMIAKIENAKPYISQEQRLVNIAFI